MNRAEKEARLVSYWLAEQDRRRRELRRQLAAAKAAGDLGRYRELREVARRYYSELLS
jgi:hypothetical protein